MSDVTHFTAWLVNDPSSLDTACMDVTILEDEAIGDPEDGDGVWATDTSKDVAFHAVTTVDAKEGDGDTARREAEELMRAAGWRTVGGWDATANAYIATVARA